MPDNKLSKVKDAIVDSYPNHASMKHKTIYRNVFTKSIAIDLSKFNFFIRCIYRRVRFDELVATSNKIKQALEKNEITVFEGELEQFSKALGTMSDHKTKAIAAREKKTGILDRIANKIWYRLAKSKEDIKLADKLKNELLMAKTASLGSGQIKEVARKPHFIQTEIDDLFQDFIQSDIPEKVKAIVDKMTRETVVELAQYLNKLNLTYVITKGKEGSTDKVVVVPNFVMISKFKEICNQVNAKLELREAFENVFEKTSFTHLGEVLFIKTKLLKAQTSDDFQSWMMAKLTPADQIMLIDYLSTGRLPEKLAKKDFNRTIFAFLDAAEHFNNSQMVFDVIKFVQDKHDDFEYGQFVYDAYKRYGYQSMIFLKLMNTINERTSFEQKEIAFGIKEQITNDVIKAATPPLPADGAKSVVVSVIFNKNDVDVKWKKFKEDVATVNNQFTEARLHYDATHQIPLYAQIVNNDGSEVDAGKVCLLIKKYNIGLLEMMICEKAVTEDDDALPYSKLIEFVDYLETSEVTCLRKLYVQIEGDLLKKNNTDGTTAKLKDRLKKHQIELMFMASTDKTYDVKYLDFSQV